MPSTTTRLAIPYPLSTDPVNVPSDMDNLASRIDTIIGLENFGTISARPAAGNEGFKYFATDQTNSAGTTGVWYYDNGSTWIAVNPAISYGTTASASAPGASESPGTSASLSRADHVHGREAGQVELSGFTTLAGTGGASTVILQTFQKSTTITSGGLFTCDFISPFPTGLYGVVPWVTAPGVADGIATGGTSFTLAGFSGVAYLPGGTPMAAGDGITITGIAIGG